MPSALIFIADGTEEMEFTITYDTLVRAGIKCVSALVNPQNQPPSTATNIVVATCSRGVKIVPDITFDGLEGAEEFDILVIPGGAKGAETLSQNEKVQKLVRLYVNRQKVVGMICAGSLAALTSNLPTQRLTSHPSVKDSLAGSFDYREDSVVVSGSLVTSRGPGTAFPFALKLVEIVLGKDERDKLVGPMVFPPGSSYP